MKSISGILILILFGEIGASQSPAISWESVFGGSGSDRAYSIISTIDGGFLIVGDSESTDGQVTGNHGNSDIWLVKVNSEGDLEYERSFGGSGVEYASEIIKSSDGGFIIAGSTSSVDGDIILNHGSSDAWVLKLFADGSLDWQKTYGGSQSDGAISVIETADGSFTVAGYSNSNDGDVSGNHGDYDLWCFNINSTGNLQWQYSLGGSEYEWPGGIVNTIDGGYLVVGETNSGSWDVEGFHGYFDYWVVKLSAEGEMEWNKAYGGSDFESASDVVQNQDGTYIIVGQAVSDDGDVAGHDVDNYADYWIIKLSNSGDLLWQRSYGGTGAEHAYSLDKTTAGDYLIAGFATSPNDGDVAGHHDGTSYGDYWIVQIDSAGYLQWQYCYGGTSSDEGYSIIENSDSKVIIAGWASSSDGDVTGHIGDEMSTDYWIVQLEKPCNHNRYYADIDTDGFGDANNFIYSCIDTLGYVANNTDCDDTNPDIYPGAPEILNGLDDDCDGLSDEGLGIENTVNNSFVLYPNPTQDVLFLVSDLQQETVIEICDLTGKIVLTTVLNSNTIQFDIHGLNAGVYSVRIHSKSVVIVKHFVKL